MMKDIREYKKTLRQRYREYRTKLQPEIKSKMDADICSRVIKLRQYQQADVILVYVSTPIEVDTRNLIQLALSQGKQVAVPRCVPGTRQMEFYLIKSLEELSPGTFGVLEPLPDSEYLLPENAKGICIVPGLCFDQYGYRLGYGKGYYDRFLSGYQGITIGICYGACVRHSLIHGRFDRPVELLITERYIKRIAAPSSKTKIQKRWEHTKHGRTQENPS